MEHIEKWMKIMEDGPKQKIEKAEPLTESACGCGSYDCNSCFPLTESADEIADILAENEIFDEVFDLAEGDDNNKYTDDDYPDVVDTDKSEDEITDDDYPKITKEDCDEEDDTEELDEGELPPWLKDKDEDDDSDEVDEACSDEDDDTEELDEGELPPWLKDDDEDEDDDSEEVDEAEDMDEDDTEELDEGAFDDDEFARFEPATNICPHCEGRGEHYVDNDHDGVSRSYKCEHCDGVGEIHEDGIPGEEWGPDDQAYADDEYETEEPEWDEEMAQIISLAGLGEDGQVAREPGEESPFTHVMQEEEPEDEFAPDDTMVDLGDEPMDTDMDMAAPEPSVPVSAESDDVSELINKIQYMQDMGISMSDRYFDPDKLWDANPEMIQRIYAKVTGEMEEDAFQHAHDGTGKSPNKRFRPKSEWDDDGAGLEPEYDDMMDLGHREEDDPDEMVFDDTAVGTASPKGRKGTLDADAINQLAVLDIDSAKESAIDMISNSSTTDRKRAQLLRNVGNARRTDQVVALLYNMLLAGEGMSTVGGKWNKRYEGVASVPGLNESADVDVVRAMKALFD